MNRHSAEKAKFYPMATNKGQNTISRGQTGAIQVWPMNVPRELYHTDWVADRTINWLSGLDPADPFFCWMSFPDPHHPWDVPESETHRVHWRDVPLPRLFRENRAELEALLEQKPKHWRGYFEGSLWTNLESPREFVPAEMTADQIREINAMTHIENELIDEACQRVFDVLAMRGQLDNTDILFTTDHGELQGDFGLLFKGPYHVDALMRLPMIWRPAAALSVPAAEVTAPVGHVDLASTFCAIAGIETPDYCEGRKLPLSNEGASKQRREHVLTEWDSGHRDIDMHMKTIFERSGWLCTTYGKSRLYEGTEGELYNMNDDPDQLVNLWDDPGCAQRRADLLELLQESLPPARSPRLERRAPV